MTSTIKRRTVLAFATLGTAFAAAPVFAQTYPDKPIRLIVPFAVGGGTDILARDLAPRLSEEIGQPVIVDNKAGAGGNLGADAVAKAPADGYTLLFGSNSLSINAGLYPKLPFNPVTAFAPIGTVATAPLLLVVHPESGIRSVRDLIDQAKAAPGKLNWSAPGTGTPHHLASELFNSQTGSNIVHIQYKGGGPAINDLLGRQTQASIQTLASVRSFIVAKKLMALGVASSTRTPLLPDVPTIAESGVPDYEVNLWYGLFAPAGTPSARIATINKALNKLLADATLQTKFNAQGYELRPGSPDALGQLYAQDLKRSAKVIADAHIKVD